MIQTLHLSVLASSLVLSTQANASALASVQLDTHYAFDQNVEMTVKVTDNKTTAPADDPLNNLVFTLTFSDKITTDKIAEVTGRLWCKWQFQRHW